MSHAFALSARLLISIFALLGLHACSGGVSGPAPVTDPSRITILPATATLYSGVPTTFVVTGGTGSYIVSSSNQAVVPVSGGINGNNLVITPNNVAADTDITLTVRDTGTTPTASATLTVKPGTVSNEITVTATSTQGLACAPAICSGGDAEVAVTLSQAGAPLIGRAVRFDAVTGDYRFITSSSGSPIEVLDTSATVVTDQSGRARARIRVLASAANQTALLQATDTASGAFQRTSFAIAQATGTSPGFFAAPSSITFQGARLEECAGTNLSALIYVFGGTPPYFVANTISTLIVRPEIVSSSGGGFSVTPTGACIGLPGVPIVIRDSAGRTTTVNVANIPGTTAIPALSASPSSVNLSSCDASANVQVAGGRGGTYFVASGSDALVATISGSTVTIRRRNPSGPTSATGNIGISDGTSVVNVSVTLSGAALGTCPSAVLAASPTSVTLTDCSSSAQVFLSGGSGTYTATASSGSISTSISGNVLSIRRTTGSGAFSGGSVTVSDGSSTLTIAVQATGAGAGSCGGGGLTVNPNSVTLLDCDSAVVVSASGATGAVTATPSSSSLTATVSGFFLSSSGSVAIRRTNPSNAFPGGTVVVSDNNSSATITVNATGAGAGICPSPPPPITVSPSTLTLNDCTNAVQATISGGTGSFSASSNNSSVTASVSGRILSVRRTNPSSAFPSATIIVSDGTSTPFEVTVSGGPVCPTPAGGFSATPNTVNLTDCSGSAQVNLSGGSGTYSASSDSGSIVASVSGSVLSIRRAVPSAATSGGTVLATDGSTTLNISVTTSGAGAGACSSPINATPSLIQLTDCTRATDPSAVRVTLSGGSGTYIANPSTSSVELSVIDANTISVGRRRPSSAFTAPATIAVTDSAGSPNTNITVDATPAGAASCPP